MGHLDVYHLLHPRLSGAFVMRLVECGLFTTPRTLFVRDQRRGRTRYSATIRLFAWVDNVQISNASSLAEYGPESSPEDPSSVWRETRGDKRVILLAFRLVLPAYAQCFEAIVNCWMYLVSFLSFRLLTDQVWRSRENSTLVFGSFAYGEPPSFRYLPPFQ